MSKIAEAQKITRAKITTFTVVCVNAQYINIYSTQFSYCGQYCILQQIQN